MGKQEMTKQWLSNNIKKEKKREKTKQFQFQQVPKLMKLQL